MSCKISENNEWKIITSSELNSIFNKKNGFTATWGKTKDDNPQFCKYGPMILDIEITEKCNGVVHLDGIRRPCKFCYKSNGPTGKNMTLAEFKLILSKMPKTLGQCALGADSTGTTNPDMFKMLEYARSVDIIPNLTIADVSDEVADKLSKLCGAVAISRYDDKNICYNSVKKLTDKGMSQVNIHHIIHSTNIEQIKETFYDIKTDKRLEKLNAIVLLSLKTKGRGINFKPASIEQFKEIVELAFKLNISYGMDSCSATKFLSIIKDRPDYKELEQVVEPCESSCFSCYISSNSEYFPCSFCEKVEGWVEGIKITKDTDFIKDIWYNPKVKLFRETLMSCKRACPLYEV